MNTIDATTNTTTPQSENTQPSMIQKLGNTTYDVYIHFSQTSKETMTDKVLRLIRNEVSTGNMS
ncbi:MAG: transposon-encoded TnpW family protein [Oscillospiraceae bacterium]|nr:transposon-encoded TnpW family protein [Oscillospiraceae bacterium]